MYFINSKDHKMKQKLKKKKKMKTFPTKNRSNPRSYWQYKIDIFVVMSKKNINCIYSSCQT